ncbi:MAG TPA: T9SS type A sorting domain-containing protein [Flavobacteriaceae bacterium]|nr:T9SS type A sorting domain-containing protein [Flavobacteriaceae bacterium]
MKKFLLTLLLIFTITAHGQNCVPANTVSPVLCMDSANNIYIVDPMADVQITIEDINGTKQNVVWSPKDFLYLLPNQNNSYPGNLPISDIYFNGAPPNQVYTYTASYQISGCPAVTETFTFVTGGFTYNDFCFGDVKTLADTDILNIPDANLSWYSDAAGTMSIPNTTSVVVGTTYYVDLGYTGCSNLFPVVVEYGTPLPIGDTTQEFCTTATWTNAGLTNQGGTVADLNVSGQNLSWYSDAAGTIPIANPNTTVLVNGTTYYVSQTINGCESPLLAITATERQFPCFKNPGFEDVTLGTYDFYDKDTDKSYQTCNIGTNTVTNMVTPGPLDSTADECAPVSESFDPLLNYHGLLLSQTSPDTNVSDYAVRLNSYNGGNYGGTYSNKVSKMETDFIAGEVFVFDYSLILRAPQVHPYDETPFFEVRILDKNGNEFADRCILSSSQTNFFLDVTQENGPGDIDPTYEILYTEWSCLKINTSSIQGQRATVEFLVADCAIIKHVGYVYIDNIFVGKLADVTCNDFICPSPTNLSLTNTTNQSADISWDFVANASNGYEWFVFISGDNPSTDAPIATGTTATVTDTSVSITGLNPQTSYDFYVSANCATIGSSYLAGPLVFGTFPTPSGLNIGNSTATSVDVSWIENGTATQWELKYGSIGFDPDLGGLSLVDNDGVPSETISGLTPDTDYDIYVRSVYGTLRSANSSGVSAWEGPKTFSTLLSIDESVFKGFKFTPNPVQAKLFLSAQGNIRQVVIYDILGKTISSSKPNAFETVLDLSELSTGVYFMKVLINDSAKVYRLIKE